jgi:hypothetical protein
MAADFAFRWIGKRTSYATYEAAEKAGKAIKKDHAILHVAVYDRIESINKIIELP